MDLAKRIFDSRNVVYRKFLGKRIVFYHVPKCGGTSISRALRKKYFLSQHSVGAPLTVKTCRGVLEDDSRNAVRGFRLLLLDYLIAKDYFMVGGHVPFLTKTYEKYSSSREFITVLRDPVERFLSEYSNNYNKASYSSVEAELDEFVESKSAVKYGARYCEYFSGGLEFSGPSRDTIDASINNLRLFTVVGSTENMEKFASDFKEKVGSKILVGRENVSQAKVKRTVNNLSPATLRKIEDLCAPDKEIYSKIIGGL